MYHEIMNAGVVCDRFGISRPTLIKWVMRYNEKGMEGLSDKSKHPINSPNTKVNDDIEKVILSLRNQRNIGARRTQSELLRLHGIKLFLASIHKVFTRNRVQSLRRYKRRKRFKRYSMKTLGARVQIDIMKLAPNFYQYTAIDDCARYRVLRVYSRRTANNIMV